MNFKMILNQSSKEGKSTKATQTLNSIVEARKEFQGLTTLRRL